MIGHDRAGPCADDLYFSDRLVLVQHRAGALRRCGESKGQPAVFYLMISRAQHRAGDPGPQMRLEAPRVRSREPFQLEPKALLKIIGET